jgi:hypothetical protein
VLGADYGLGVRGIVVRILKVARNCSLTKVSRPALDNIQLNGHLGLKNSLDDNLTTITIRLKMSGPIHLPFLIPSWCAVPHLK